MVDKFSLFYEINSVATVKLFDTLDELVDFIQDNFDMLETARIEMRKIKVKEKE